MYDYSLPNMFFYCYFFSDNDLYTVIFSSVEVLTTLTTDVGRILSKLHQVQPKGNIKFCTGVKVAHVSIRHKF